MEDASHDKGVQAGDEMRDFRPQQVHLVHVDIATPSGPCDVRQRLSNYTHANLESGLRQDSILLA